jgi:uncharacterized protein YdaT
MSLNSRQLKAIPILIGCDTVEGAARKAGISKNTIYTWMQQEEFRKKHNKDLTDKQAKKAAQIANAILEKTSDEAKAIRVATARVKLMKE